ncbi:MAG: hypothetical protein VYC39_14210 [Myxococcota bacterium]|nr:hypothetical protein [Myxococcota bacterium]
MTDTPQRELSELSYEPQVKRSKAEQNVPKVFELEQIAECAAQEDSVLLKALKLRRNPLERLIQSTSKLGAQIKRKMRQTYRAIRVHSETNLESLASEPMDKMKKYQSIFIGAAIALSMFFVGFSLVSSNSTYPESGAITATPPPLKLDDIPLDYHPPASPSPTVQAADKSYTAEIAKATSSVARTNPVSIPSSPEKATTATFYTSRKTWLRSKTSKKAIKVLRLRKNARITTHPEFPTKEGWALATTKRGHIGFVMKKYLKKRAIR